MALTKTNQTVVSSQTCSSGYISGHQNMGYAVSGIITITNDSTPPTTPCQVYIDFNNVVLLGWKDGPMIGQGDTIASSVTIIPFSYEVGKGGDWNYYRIKFEGVTGQSVTIAAEASILDAI